MKQTFSRLAPRFAPLAIAALIPTAGWAALPIAIGGEGADYGKVMAIGPNGDIALGGYFQFTADFNPGPGTAEFDSPASSLSAYIALYDRFGQYKWAVPIGSPANDVTHGIKIDSTGAVVAIGYLGPGTVEFDPGPGSTALPMTGPISGWIARYLPTGELDWARAYSGTGEDAALGVTIGPGGDYWITGFFNQTVDFDPGNPGGELTSAGGANAFVLRLQPDGTLVSLLQVGGTGNVLGGYVTFDDTGSMYFAGTYEGTVDFDPGPGEVLRTSASPSDSFIVKYTPSGDFDSVWTFDSTSSMLILSASLRLDAAGNIFASGLFSGTADFDPDFGQELRTADGLEDGYLLKLNAAGEFQWVVTLGTNSSLGEGIHSHALAPDGTTYVTGWIRGAVDFNPLGTPTVLTPPGTGDAESMFLASYDPDGNLRWARVFGDALSGPQFRTVGTTPVLDDDGTLLVCGQFFGTIAFGPGGMAPELTSAGFNDAFIARFDPADGSVLEILPSSAHPGWHLLP